MEDRACCCMLISRAVPAPYTFLLAAKPISIFFACTCLCPHLNMKKKSEQEMAAAKKKREEGGRQHPGGPISSISRRRVPARGGEAVAGDLAAIQASPRPIARCSTPRRVSAGFCCRRRRRAHMLYGACRCSLRSPVLSFYALAQRAAAARPSAGRNSRFSSRVDLWRPCPPCPSPSTSPAHARRRRCRASKLIY